MYTFSKCWCSDVVVSYANDRSPAPPCLALDTLSAGQCPVKLQTEQIAYILQTPSAAAGHQHSFISICEIFRLFTQLDFNDYPEGLPVWKFICPRIFDCWMGRECLLGGTHGSVKRVTAWTGGSGFKWSPMTAATRVTNGRRPLEEKHVSQIASGQILEMYD